MSDSAKLGRRQKVKFGPRESIIQKKTAPFPSSIPPLFPAASTAGGLARLRLLLVSMEKLFGSVSGLNPCLHGDAKPGRHGSESFTSALGKLYRVERVSNSQAGDWEIVADNIAGTGGIVRVLDTNATGSSSWLYRVKLVL